MWSLLALINPMIKYSQALSLHRSDPDKKERYKREGNLSENVNWKVDFLTVHTYSKCVPD